MMSYPLINYRRLFQHVVSTWYTWRMQITQGQLKTHAGISRFPLDVIPPTIDFKSGNFAEICNFHNISKSYSVICFISEQNLFAIKTQYRARLHINRMNDVFACSLEYKTGSYGMVTREGGLLLGIMPSMW